jgi:hypothetical protein
VYYKFVCWVGIFWVSLPHDDVIMRSPTSVRRVFMFFSFLPVVCHVIQILLAQGCTVDCVLEFRMILSVLFARMTVATGATGVLTGYILCRDVYSAAVCWRGVKLCVYVTVLYSDYVWCRI